MSYFCTLKESIVTNIVMRKTIFDLLDRKGSLPVSMLTAYDFNTARTIDEAGVDMILVGDSLGNVMLGYENTLAVTVEDMIHHGKAVCRGAKSAFVVVDMPFMSYQTSVEDAVRNAGRIMKETNCQAVKLEGGVEYADRIRAIVQAGIPVVAHIGLTPQSVNAMGGYKVQGKSLEQAQKLLKDAKAVEKAGAFAITLECVPAALAKMITTQTKALTIGIGAGNGCDGQVLVYQDMLGFTNGFTPKFVKKYADLHSVMLEAFKQYKQECEDRSFPAAGQTYAISDDVMEKLFEPEFKF
jgi:3-methyl-2-oxobutanoate hydroxymethyltransferase